MAWMSEQQAADDAYRFLRRNTTGDLRFDEQWSPLRYVVGPQGQLVAPVSYAMLESVDTVLFVPEFREGAMEVQVTLEPLDPDGPHGGLTDRWRIYHGEPQEARWAVVDIDAARYHEWVIDGVALLRSNPIGADEARLCRHINEERRDELRRVCRTFASADVKDPMVVGVDPCGFDVRRRFDVIRLEAPEAMETAGDVERVFRGMVESSAGGP